MMNVHQAKSQLSKLLDAAERGEDVIITRRGNQFRLVKAEVADRPNLFGSMKHLFPDGWIEAYEKAEQEFNEELDAILDEPIFPEDDR